MPLIAAGNERAFEELYTRYSRPIHSYFFRMLRKDKEIAADFTQELFSKVFRHAEGFDVKRNFKTWLYSMAHNQCKNEYAKHEVRAEARMTIATAEVHEHDRDMDRSKFEEALQDALSQLDETKRTTFELRFVHELSNPEIAETMGCSEGTVKSRIFYTLKELNGILQEYKELLLSFLFILLKS